jgi:hypothetical protein
MQQITSNSVSLAGEFAVLSQLALRGYDANMTLGRTKGIDILVYSPQKEKSFQLEVKTNFGGKTSVSKVHGKAVSGWMMNKKHENIESATLFYCFVNISKDSNSFKFFIVPSNIVARYVAEQHKLWLREKSKEGKRVNEDTDMRVFRLGVKGEKYSIATPIAEQFENNWDFSESP